MDFSGVPLDLDKCITADSSSALVYEYITINVDRNPLHFFEYFNRT